MGARMVGCQRAEERRPATRLEEAYMGKEGVLTVRDIYEIGKVKDEESGGLIAFEAVVVQLGSDKEVAGLGIRLAEKASRSQIDKRFSLFVDYEEIEPLSEAMSDMTELSEGEETDLATRKIASFETKGGLKVKFCPGLPSFFMGGEISRDFFSVSKVSDIQALLYKGRELLGQHYQQPKRLKIEDIWRESAEKRALQNPPESPGT